MTPTPEQAAAIRDACALCRTIGEAGWAWGGPERGWRGNWYHLIPGASRSPMLRCDAAARWEAVHREALATKGV